jgi:hypothetical protein
MNNKQNYRIRDMNDLINTPGMANLWIDRSGYQTCLFWQIFCTHEFHYCVFIVFSVEVMKLSRRTTRLVVEYEIVSFKMYSKYTK